MDARYQMTMHDSTNPHATTAGAADLAGPQDPGGFYGRHGKRWLDIAGALVFLVTFAPLMAIIALIQLAQHGGVLFSHRRVGRFGEEFDCLKFRTMVPDADQRLKQVLASDPEARQEWQESRKLSDDPRITSIGNVLRRSSLDELPQLVNVLRGEMSLVGPRPVTPPELEMYGDALDSYLGLRPGLTGKWQVSGRNDVSYDARVRLDQGYADNYSLIGDLVILVSTVRVVLGATGR